MFDEVPVPLARWLGPGYMGLVQMDDDGNELGEEDLDAERPHEPLSPIQFGVLRHVEQIYLPETYELLRQATKDLRWHPARFVNFVWMMVGKGGGKDRIAALAQLRIAYLLMCLRDPQRYQRIGSTSKIDMLNTASSEGQAEAIYFAELKGLLDFAPWFRGHYTMTSKEIVYDKRILGHSGNSKEESQEGMNLILGVLDEIDAFRTKEELEKTARTARGAMLNAQGIFDMMHTSGGSRFPFTFKVMGLSWPRFVGSFIWNKHRAGLADLALKGRRSRTYVIPRENGATTWESNPTKRRADYDADFEENPELSRAKYMCLPPESESPYFRNRQIFESAFDPVPPRPPVVVSYDWGLPGDLELTEGPFDYVPRSDEVRPREGWQVDLIWNDDYVPRDAFPRAIHVDTGISHDRCGISMAFVRGYTVTQQKRSTKCPSCDGVGRLRPSLQLCPECGGKRELVEEVTVHRPLVTIDLLTYFQAPAATPDHPKGEVELRWVRRLIFELLGRGFPIQRVTFDGYQSTDSLQLLRAHGLEAELLSLDRNMEAYDTAKSILYAGGLECPADPLLITELKALTVVNGKKVDHPPGGSKDLSDAWAGSIVGAIAISEFGGVSPESVSYAGKPGWGDDLRGLVPRQVEPALELPSIPPDLAKWSGPPR